MKKLLLMMLGVLLSLPALARDFTYEYDGQTLTYTVIDEDAKTCQTKAGYIDWDENVGHYGNYITENLVIPEYAKDENGGEYKVVAIGEVGFFFSSFESVSFPQSIEKIGAYAFYGCSELTSVTIPESVTSIDEWAFNACSGLTKAEFASIEALCNITFGAPYANPLFIAHHLYINGQEITELVIPEGITSIGDETFFGCSYLTSVTIPATVTSIGSGAFYNCSGLTKAEFASIEALCNISFYNVSSNPLYEAHNLYINGQEITELVIPESVTSIGAASFCCCTNLISVIIPESVTSIGASSFYGCSGLESIDIPASVTSIGYMAFMNCPYLTSVTIPEGVTLIEDYTFYGCNNLISINIPESVTSIGDYSFYECSNLPSINIPESVTSIGESAFSYCSGLESIDIPASVSSIGVGAFFCCTGLTSVSIPESITSINSSTFSRCTRLASVTIPKSVTSIEGFAFSNCSNLESIVIPPSVTSIGSGVFSSCFNLTSVNIPEGVTSIGDMLFESCYALPSITIPSSVTSIGMSAFSGCQALTSVYYASKDPTVADENVFYSEENKIYDQALLYVPEEAVEKYKELEPWKYFKNIQAYNFSNGIEEITADFNPYEAYEVFNLNGVKVGDNVEALAPGIYIIRQSNTIKKIAIK